MFVNSTQMEYPLLFHGKTRAKNARDWNLNTSQQWQHRQHEPMRWTMRRVLRRIAQWKNEIESNKTMMYFSGFFFLLFLCLDWVWLARFGVEKYRISSKQWTPWNWDFYKVNRNELAVCSDVHTRANGTWFFPILSSRTMAIDFVMIIRLVVSRMRETAAWTKVFVAFSFFTNFIYKLDNLISARLFAFSEELLSQRWEDIINLHLFFEEHEMVLYRSKRRLIA